MKRVFKSFLTLAMAMAMVGLAVTQARADRITLNSECVSCNPETLTVSGGSLSFSTPGFTVDFAMAKSAALEFASDVVSASDFSVASGDAQTATKVSAAQLAVRNSTRPASAAVALLSNSMLWPFSGSHAVMNPTSSGSLALPIGNGRSGSFSVVAGNVANAPSISSATAKGGTTFQANGFAPPDGGPPGGSPVPEPTTMLLFGSGLIGAAAVLRKRLKGRRADSKQASASTDANTNGNPVNARVN